MKYPSILTLILITTLIISGCGTQAPPTTAAVDLQGTVAAAAFTVIAETQAAIPTATPPPPTPTFTHTPLPTITLLPLTAPAGMPTSTPNSNPGGEDPCIYKVLPSELQGKKVKMRIDNSTKATVSVSVNLNQTVPNGQCGYRSYTLDPGQFIIINDLVEGCYTLWAWNPDPDNYFIATNGTDCILDDSNTWSFDISTSSIKLGT